MRYPQYLTIPWPEPFQPRRRPAVALRALAGQLQQRGITSLYGYACDRIGVLSLPAVSVWTNGRVLWWRADGEENGWPAADPEGAADQLTGLAATPGGLAPPRDASPPWVRRLRPSSRAVASAPTGKIRRRRFALHPLAAGGH
jgi:hypothetical protein